MPFDIVQFSSQIDRYGIQKGSHYDVIITPPNGLSNPIINDIPIRANSVNLPGVNVGTDDIKHKGYGLNERRPNTIGYEDISITLIADRAGQLQKFFNDWMELVFPTNDENVGAAATELFEYPVNYYGGLNISVYDATGAEHSNWNFIHPFPVNVGAVQLGWEHSDTVLILPVSFAYRSYKINSVNKGIYEI